MPSDLPPKSEIVQRVELGEAQRDLYETVRLAMHEKIRAEIAAKGLARSQIVILDALLKETPEQRQRPGVRALLVYPLNALANDQLYKRIVPLFVGRFASAGIKVGRFTGLTRDDVNRANAVQDVLTSDPSLRSLFGETIPANW